MYYSFFLITLFFSDTNIVSGKIRKIIRRGITIKKNQPTGRNNINNINNKKKIKDEYIFTIVNFYVY